MRLLLIDDHPLFAIGFAHALTHASAGIAVETAPSLAAGIDLARRRAGFDIVLVDYRLGGDDGLTGLRRFAELFPLMARALISGDESPALVQRAREAGASAFLGKSWALEDLLAALDRVVAGEEVFDTSPARPARNALTPRQLEVLALVAEGQPNKRIALALGLAERTVKLHVTALLEQLGAANRTHLLVRARECGLL